MTHWDQEKIRDDKNYNEKMNYQSDVGQNHYHGLLCTPSFTVTIKIENSLIEKVGNW